MGKDAAKQLSCCSRHVAVRCGIPAFAAREGCPSSNKNINIFPEI
jgi:hypothetical protein